MAVQNISVFGRGVLNSSIGVMDQPWSWSAVSDRLLQGIDRELRRQRSVQCPADHLSRESVEKNRQIYKFVLQADERDIGDPQLIHPAELHTARQVYVDFEVVI